MRFGQGTTIDGRYRLERQLGSGGMAVVWLATDTRLGREVALKLLSETLVADADFVERFEREAQIAAGVSHPAVVPVHDLGIADERPFLVMEYVDGETLGRRLDRGGEISLHVLATEMLGALEHIHEAGIVHRDVKPDNILYADDGRIRLTDFGIARMGGSSQITQTGQVLGTLRYMAPEIHDGAEPTPASDLYSLGVVLADCEGPAADAGDELAELIRSLRSPDPERRPVSARAARRALRAGQAGGTPSPEATAATQVLAGREAEPNEPVGPEREATTEQPVRREPVPEPAAEQPAPRAASSSGPSRTAILLSLAAAGILAVTLILLIDGGSGGGEQGEGSEQARSAEGEGAGGGEGESGGGATGDQSAEAESTDEGAEQAEEDGVALNDQGYELIQSGQPEQAVPVLERAVAALEDQPQEPSYAFALFNYGQALRLAGRPEEAIPILEQRLEIDNQRPTVRAELERARADAED